MNDKEFERLNMRISILFLILLFFNQLFAKQKVLILHSYHQSFAWTSSINDGIKSILTNNKELEFYIEYMDTKRYVNKKHYENLLKTYTHKYNTTKFDLIISSDNNAFDFLKKYNKSHFNNTPVVFCGVNNLKKEDTKSLKNFTGVNEEVSLFENYQLIKRMYPNVKNIYTIVDVTTTGNRIKEEIDSIVKNNKNDGINYEILQNVTFLELKETVKELPENSAILLTVFYRSSDDQYYEYDRVAKMLSSATSAPIFALWDYYLNHGILGGFLTSGFTQGVTAAFMGKKILNGQKTSSIAIQYQSPNDYYFDYSLFKKYAVNTSFLPKNSFIINLPKSIYSQYKKEVIGIGIIFVLMLIIILGQFIYTKRIKTAKKEVKLLNKEIVDTQKDIIFKMGAIGEARCQETGMHVKRVAEYSKLLALHYGISKKETELIKLASPMHDIGKVAIPDTILKKPGKLTFDEFEIMKTHAQIGYEMLKDSNKKILKAAAIIAHEHQEKFDGTGYPRGLKEDNIHIYGRITALADVFDALGSERPYKKAWKDEKIFSFIKEQSGKHFDPQLVDIFFTHLEEFLYIRNKFKEI